MKRSSDGLSCDNHFAYLPTKYLSMSETVFTNFMYFWMAFAIILMPVQIFMKAPYGRHTNRKWGILMDNRLGWIIMEAVSLFFFAYFFLTGDNPISTPMWVFFAMYAGHYINRSFIFPLRTRTSGKKIPLAVVLMAMIFNTVNGYTNGYYLGSLGEPYGTEWLTDWRFILGTLLFLTGVLINTQSDKTLRNLRKPGETGYSIPTGGLFNKVSCPNLLGEIIEWTGFAIACWNLPALAFAAWTFSNLLPRAMSHHKWYKETFDDYPAERKAIIPYII